MNKRNYILASLLLALIVCGFPLRAQTTVNPTGGTPIVPGPSSGGSGGAATPATNGVLCGNGSANSVRVCGSGDIATSASVAAAQAAATAAAVAASLPLAGGTLGTYLQVPHVYAMNADGSFQNTHVEWFRSTNCIHDLVVNPMGSITNSANMVVPCFGTGDVFARIVNALTYLAYVPNITVEVPPGSYGVSAALPLIKMNDIHIRMDNSSFYPAVTTGTIPAFTRTEDGVNIVKNVYLLGGKFISNPSTGACFTSYISDQNIDAADPLNGLYLEPDEIGCTTANGIDLQSLTYDFGNVNGNALTDITLKARNGRPYIHNTGGQSIEIKGATNVTLDDFISATPGAGGPSGVGEPTNISVASSVNVSLSNCDISGTPIWNLAPADSHAPPSGFYPIIDQKVSVTHCVFHDSQGSTKYCENFALAQTDLPFGGTSDNYQLGCPASIHSDGSTDVTFQDNIVDKYAGVLSEISTNSKFTNNLIKNSYGPATTNSSRDQAAVINDFTSATGVTGENGATLSIVNSVPFANATTTTGCSAGCLQASVLANTTGAVWMITNSSTSAIWNTAQLPRVAVNVWGGSNNTASGQYSLVFSTLLGISGCTDTNATVVPMPPTYVSPYITPLTSRYFLPVADYTRLMFAAAIRTVCLTTTGSGSSVSTITVGGLEQYTWSANNDYSENTIEGTDGAPFYASGPADLVTFDNNTIRGACTFGNAPNCTYGVLGSINAFSPGTGTGQTNRLLTGLEIKGNKWYGDRALTIYANGAVTAVAIGSVGATGNTVPSPVVADNKFYGANADTLPIYLAYSYAAGVPYTDLDSYGNEGIHPPGGYNDYNDDSLLVPVVAGNQFCAAGSPTGTCYVNLYGWFTHAPIYNCENKTSFVRVHCTAVALGGSKYQLQIVEDTTDPNFTAGTDSVYYKRARLDVPYGG